MARGNGSRWRGVARQISWRQCSKLGLQAQAKQPWSSAFLWATPQLASASAPWRRVRQPQRRPSSWASRWSLCTCVWHVGSWTWQGFHRSRKSGPAWLKISFVGWAMSSVAVAHGFVLWIIEARSSMRTCGASTGKGSSHQVHTSWPTMCSNLQRRSFFGSQIRARIMKQPLGLWASLCSTMWRIGWSSQCTKGPLEPRRHHGRRQRHCGASPGTLTSGGGSRRRTACASLSGRLLRPMHGRSSWSVAWKQGRG
mmetsp:Transcript_7072/g.14713  ORF Transcript_7072/g.14713 Transcript_7072/m.14713 type:complete len:254 (+) Transcript_7072:491-1252(+)